MKRYSKKVREEAALICAIAASTPDLAQCYTTIACRLGGISFPEIALGEESSEWLAFQAWRVTKYFEQPDAEAEALIRTGWSPS